MIQWITEKVLNEINARQKRKRYYTCNLFIYKLSTNERKEKNPRFVILFARFCQNRKNSNFGCFSTSLLPRHFCGTAESSTLYRYIDW